MTLRRSSPILAIVPYASLFSHSDILQDVFRSPSHHVAVTVERPGKATQEFTYGQLQSDVVRFADGMQRVLRLGDMVDKAGSLEAMPTNKNNENTSAPHLAFVAPHLQLPIDETRVQGLFHAPSAAWRDSNPKHCFSHEFHSSTDTGEYNVALLCHPGYEFVVALLACWALNLMVVPLCPHHKFLGEISYYLEHSGARVLVGDRLLMEQLLPKPFLALSEREGHGRSVSNNEVAADSSSGALYQVRHVIDMTKWKAANDMSDQHSHHRQGNHPHLCAEAIHHHGEHQQRDEVTWLPPASSTRLRPNSSEDVLELAKEAERVLEKQRLERELDEIAKQFSASQQKSSYGSSDLFRPSCLSFDDERADTELNPLFYARWKQMQQMGGPHHRWAVPCAANDCLMIYTSGTTAKPKGVVHTHRSVSRQCTNLQNAWEWRDTDSILNVLPLHHVHGLVNVLLCTLKSGARCVFTPFDSPKRIADRLTMGDISLFMAVPTIYAKLVSAVQREMSPIEQTGWRKSVSQQLRLMVSGSAALPVPLLDQVRNLSGHTLLERYGMTEVGMALSQPYRPVEGRLPGTVGSPLPGVEALVILSAAEEEEKQEQAAGGAPPSSPSSSSVVGSLALRSEALFDRYWNNPAATVKDAVSHDGRTWFDTGDTVASVAAPSLPKTRRLSSTASSTPMSVVFTILGRSSVDILKCRGFKISALEVEANLLQLAEKVDEVAVFGIPHAVLGEEIVAVCVLSRAFQNSLQHGAGGQETLSPGHDEVIVVSDVRHRKDDLHNSSSAAEGAATAPHWSRDAARTLSAALASTVAPYKIPTKYVFVKAIPRNAMGKVNKKELNRQLFGSK